MGWAETMAFWDAVDAGSVHGMKAAVLAGASVDHYNAGLATALHKAAEQGDTAMVSALIDSGASVNLKTRIGNETALLLAAAHGRVQAAAALLAGGADMSIKNSKGQTAFAVATERRHVEVIKLLSQGTEPRMLPHKKIADSIRSASAAAPPDARSVRGKPGTTTRGLLATSPPLPPTADGSTPVQMTVYIVDPTDRRHSVPPDGGLPSAHQGWFHVVWRPPAGNAGHVRARAAAPQVQGMRRPQQFLRALAAAQQVQRVWWWQHL